MDLRVFNLAFATLLKNQTSAADRVGPAFVPARGYPQISFDIVGETPWTGYLRATDQRVAVRCHAVRIDDCRKLYSEVRAVLLPEDEPVHGFYGDVTVTVAAIGAPRTVHFSGIQHNAGPNALEDPPTGTPMLESFWLVPHYELVSA